MASRSRIARSSPPRRFPSKPHCEPSRSESALLDPQTFFPPTKKLPMENSKQPRFTVADQGIGSGIEKDDEEIEALLREIPQTTTAPPQSSSPAAAAARLRHYQLLVQNNGNDPSALSDAQPAMSVLSSSTVRYQSSLNHHLRRSPFNGWDANGSSFFEGSLMPGLQAQNGDDVSVRSSPEMMGRRLPPLEMVEEPALIEGFQALQIEPNGTHEIGWQSVFPLAGGYGTALRSRQYGLGYSAGLPDFSPTRELHHLFAKENGNRNLSSHLGLLPSYTGRFYQSLAGNGDASSICRDYRARELGEQDALVSGYRLWADKLSVSPLEDGISHDWNMGSTNFYDPYQGETKLCHSPYLMPREHLYSGRNLMHTQHVPLPDCSLLQGKWRNLQGIAGNLPKERRNSHVIGEPVNHLCGMASPRHQSSAAQGAYRKDTDGFVYNIAKDQHGCRNLQLKLLMGTAQEKDLIFDGIINYLIELIMDPFGNYLVQKLLEICTEEQRMKVLLVLTEEPSQLAKISLNVHGTRVVQKLIETLQTRQQVALVVKSLQPRFLDLTKDLNGNHVVQRCLQSLAPEDNKCFFYAAAKYCIEISTHQHGCVVMQRCIDSSRGRYRADLVTEICNHALLLSQDNFGNYVVQYVLEREDPSTAAKLMPLFKGKYVQLSMHKFSSNVVEKCLKHFNIVDRAKIIMELLSVPRLEQLLSDRYANYVVKSALESSEGVIHDTIVNAILPHTKALRTNPHCKKIISMALSKK